MRTPRARRLAAALATVAALATLTAACSSGGAAHSSAPSETASRPAPPSVSAGPATLSASASAATSSSSTAPPTGATGTLPPLPIPAGTDKTYTLNSGGHERSYIVHAPKQRSTARLAVILAFHGADNTAAGMEARPGLDELADTAGFLAVYPQGYQDTWNEGAGHTPAEQAGIDDVAFVAALLAQLEHNFPVDTGAVAATGLSNGALLVELLGCRLATSLALIAPVEGQLPTSVSPSCHPARPVTVVAFHGTADSVIPYNGGPFAGVGGGTTVLSAPDSAKRWASLDGCAAASTSTATGYRVTSYARCSGGAAVELYTIIGGQHAWPNGSPVDADQVIWASLRAHAH